MLMPRRRSTGPWSPDNSLLIVLDNARERESRCGS